jgi:hypothetical protein
LPCEQLGCAGGEDLVAHPFALAEIRPVVAPAGFEFRGAADAFEFCDLIKQVSEPGDQRSERREPFVLGRGVVGLKRRSVEAHGRDYKCAGRSAGLRCGFPQVFSGKLLNVRRKFLGFPPNLRARLPAKCGVTCERGDTPPPDRPLSGGGTLLSELDNE